MAPKNRKHRNRNADRSTGGGRGDRGTEWLGGVRTLTTPITGEGEPYHPSGLIWLDTADGTVVGATVEHPETVFENAARHLRTVMAEPAIGAPRVPSRIRTASGALAEALAHAVSDMPEPIEIVVAPTPEIDKVFGSLEASLSGRQGNAKEQAPGSQPLSSQPLSSSDTDPATLLDALRALQDEAEWDGLDQDEAQRLTDALFEHYLTTPDATAFPAPLQGPELVAQLAAAHFGLVITALSGVDLEEMLFETLPARLTAPPDVARPIIETTRALFVWLDREHDLEQAAELIDLLGDDAARELEELLEDPSTYGPAKQLTMEALKAGVDFSDPKAIDDFMRSRVGRPLPFGGFHDDGLRPPPAAPPLTPEQRRTQQKRRKSNRKAARKARKKNR